MCSIGWWLCVSGGNLRSPQVVHVWVCMNGVNLNSSTLLCLNFVCLVCPNPQTDYSDITQVKNRPPLIVMKEEARSASFFIFFCASVLHMGFITLCRKKQRACVCRTGTDVLHTLQVCIFNINPHHFWLFQILIILVSHKYSRCIYWRRKSILCLNSIWIRGQWSASILTVKALSCVKQTMFWSRVKEARRKQKASSSLSFFNNLSATSTCASHDCWCCLVGGQVVGCTQKCLGLMFRPRGAQHWTYWTLCSMCEEVSIKYPAQSHGVTSVNNNMLGWSAEKKKEALQQSN